MSDTTETLTALVLSSREESEDSTRETGEVCSFCEGSGITVYEGWEHRPCVSCAPLTFVCWRQAGCPELRDVMKEAEEAP